ncbi:MAG TPA: fibronectin type III domain-containing protein [Desulfotomaculum sp.]|nr:MAG: hypothetical protein JL56_05895 [Desulfotomaculum sp. BICA1-6]HBX23977.1 fibronectin type III domain-containing protein [Desulfotomaculum sp.]
MKMKTTTLLIILIITLLFPAYAFAGTLLHDEPPGTIITFSDKEWVILEQMPDGTTYILLNSNDGNRAFDPDNTQFFNPSDSNNIGYYLNNEFYNSLSQKDLIETHSWDIKFPNGLGSQDNVTAKIALISFNEYRSYSSYYFGNILPDRYTYSWWSRSPFSAYPNDIHRVLTNGGIGYAPSQNINGVRPALYLQADVFLNDEREVISEGEQDTTPPVAPTGLTATATGQDTVYLTWNANTEPDLSSYNIYRNEVKIKGTAINSSTDTGLEPDTTYTYTVTAVDTSANESAHSEPVTVTTLPIEPDPPPAPENVSITDITDNSSTVNWSAVNGAEEYKVYLNGTLHGATLYETFELSDLEAETGYVVYVTALAAGLESEPSEQVSFETLPAPLQPPGVPTLKAIAMISGSTVSLSWGIDDLTVTKWELYMDGSLYKEFPGDTTRTIIRDLEDGEYSFAIRAVNSAGPGELSQVDTVTVKNVFVFVTPIADVFVILSKLFKSTWPLWVFVIALLVTPKIIKTTRAIIAARR